MGTAGVRSGSADPFIDNKWCMMYSRIGASSGISRDDMGKGTGLNIALCRESNGSINIDGGRQREEK